MYMKNIQIHDIKMKIHLNSRSQYSYKMLLLHHYNINISYKQNYT